MIPDVINFKNFCINQHDVVCNQKYDNTLPYSMHLMYVIAQCSMFKHLLSDMKAQQLAVCGCYGHDLIEDARLTYNDIKQNWGEEVAEVIYCCTELRGKNRAERHGEEYYKLLATNDVAIFVKLCDIIANVKYSIVTNSSMGLKHKAEYHDVIKYLYKDESTFKPMFDYYHQLLELIPEPSNTRKKRTIIEVTTEDIK